MKRKKKLSLFIFTLIAFIVLGVGYAAINNINLIINGTGSVTATQSNFDVRFLDIDGHRPSINPGSPNTVSVIDNITATFDVSTLSKKGDIATATIDVKNNSNGIGARIGLNLTNSNDTYFKVTEHIADSELQAGDITTVTVTIEMLKTPVSNTETTTIRAELTASPIDDSTATGSDSATYSIPVSVPAPAAFATDSWETIQKAVQDNNTSLYNIGDTKEVTISGVDYTVRLANKTTVEHCGDNDTAYSQTACGFVVEFTDIITKVKMQNTNTNVGGYPATLVYDYLDNTLFGQLPLELQTVIKPTRVISGHGCNSGWDNSNDTCSNPDNNGNDFSTTDYLYLLSGTEIYGVDSGGHNLWDTSAGTTHQLEYYSNNSVTFSTNSWSGTNVDKAIKQYNSTNTWWWLRAPYACNHSTFSFVNSGGSLDNDLASNNGGVAPAFRVG